MTKITSVEKSRMKTFDSVDMEDVTIDDSLLKRFRDTNHFSSLQRQYEECERTGRIDNLRLAAGLMKGELSNRLAAESDVYKWLEAVAWDIASGHSPGFKDKADEIISFIAGAQEKNGYLFIPYLINKKARRWSNLVSDHELYCGGHLIQAAVAYHRATGEKKLLDVAVKWADHVAGYFGPQAHPGTCGHPEVEMALVELYRETGKTRYLELAEFFIGQRGKGVLNGDIKIQDHLPVREQDTVEGHAVRQLYLCCGITDLYCETGDRSLIETLEKQWSNFTTRKIAVTGGAGARYQGEMFGLDYEIPNRTGYYETCAAIASFMWNWRMLQISGNPAYADIMETTLYNGILSAVSLDGLEYFYTNPMEHDGGDDIGISLGKGRGRGSNRRNSIHWDRTACCPPNMARMLAGLPGYIYGRGKDTIYVHHYLASEARINIQGTDVEITQKTRYPWDGSVTIWVNPQQEKKFSLAFRIPGWSEKVQVSVNKEATPRMPAPGTYVTVTRQWSRGDKVNIHFPMPVEKVKAHPKVTENSGCVALRRGPVVYCIESVDHPGADIHNLSLPADAELKHEYRGDLLGGVTILKGTAISTEGGEELYSTANNPGQSGETDLMAVPYFAWANRQPGAMRIWLPVGTI